MRIAAYGPLSVRVWALFIVAFLGGCAMGDHAKAVFKEQYRASAALTEAIVAAEMDEPALAEELYGREDELNAACAALQVAGQRKITKEALSPSLRWAVFTSLKECEAKTAEVERLLWEIDPQTAEIFLKQKTVDLAVAQG